MLAMQRLKGCHRCGGDLFSEPGISHDDRHVTYITCLQCGETRSQLSPSARQASERLLRAAVRR